MILEHKHDLDAFRRSIRAWLERTVPPGWERKLATASHAEFETFHQWWMAERNKVGLATPHWPVEFGGADLSLQHQIIVADEIARAGAPAMQLHVVGLNHIPATMLAWGTEEQKAKYLPGVAMGDVWCQGFSEPNAGSDLASLRCSAVRDGDHYIVNGQKIWSSNSMYAKYCILLTRTDISAPKHKGITFFVMDMNSPGIEVRPIRQSNGRAEFGELFLTDVRIPAENRVGPENEGWAVSQSTLAAERGVLAFEGIERLRYIFEEVYSASLKDNAPWLNDDALRREFMQLFAELQAGRRLIRQLLKEHEAPRSGPTMTPPIVKLTGSEHKKRFGSWLVRACGVAGQFFLPGGEAMENPMMTYVSSFGATIAAGSNEIMRNIIAERGLGLPR